MKHSFAVSATALALSSASPATANQLVDNASLEISAALYSFPDEVNGLAPSGEPAEDDPFEARLLLTARTDSQLTNRLVVNLGGYLVADSQGDYDTDFAGLFVRRHGEPAQIGFRELNLQWLGDGVDILAGRDKLATGVTELYSVIDRYRTTDYSNPVAPLELGVWQMRSWWYGQQGSLSAAILPVREPTILPALDSRWFGGVRSEDVDPGDVMRDPPINLDGAPSPSQSRSFLNLAPGTLLEVDDASAQPDDWTFWAEYRMVRSGYDLMGGGSWSPSHFPVVHQDQLFDAAELENPQVLTGYLGGSVTPAGWRIAAELLIQAVPSGRDDDYLQMLVEAERREAALAAWLGLQEIRPAIGFLADLTLEEADDGSTRRTSEVFRPFRDSLLGRFLITFNPDLELQLSGSVALNRDEKSLGASLEYRLDDRRSLLIAGQLFGGDYDTYFGRWSANDYLLAGFRFTL